MVYTIELEYSGLHKSAWLQYHKIFIDKTIDENTTIEVIWETGYTYATKISSWKLWFCLDIPYIEWPIGKICVTEAWNQEYLDSCNYSLLTPPDRKVNNVEHTVMSL